MNGKRNGARHVGFVLLAAVWLLSLSACSVVRAPQAESASSATTSTTFSAETVTTENIPAYTGSPYVALYDNVPQFSAAELTTESYEQYAPLDALGRCGTAIACIGTDLMPTEERGSIGQVKPSGWKTVKYDFVDGKYLYNRCHLIGFQLTGENANACNLITGTRYLNIQGMLPFENMVADYVKETENHVLYRVTPLFFEEESVARGVQMEGYSVEDEGEGICFNVYCYNVQPQVTIDYATGDSHADEAASSADDEGETYVLNTSSKRIHRADCASVKSVAEENRQEYGGNLDALLAQGYKKCGNCF